jgi:hypothetical protein
MQQIVDWLEKLGMPEYAQRFAENGIAIASLPHLTDQDLKEIGVLLGHRRISDLEPRFVCTAAVSAAPTCDRISIGKQIRRDDGLPLTATAQSSGQLETLSASPPPVHNATPFGR